jgi:hypothetical protein
MNAVKLHFPNPVHLSTLLSDSSFFNAIAYLNPNRLDEYNIELLDSVSNHSRFDSEVVVLSKFASGLKRLLFPASEHSIDFLNPVADQQKGGLRHGTERIIDSTDI